MGLYESHSIIHGRPFALKGKYMANVFIHFEPDPSETKQDDENDLPTYIIKGSPEEEYWRKNNPPPSSKNNKPVDFQRHKAHVAASFGRLVELKSIHSTDPKSIHARDVNGWQPLHEAVRGGFYDVVEWILSQEGCNVNERPNGGLGPTPLEIALDSLEEDDPVLGLLLKNGAKYSYDRDDGSDDDEF